MICPHCNKDTEAAPVVIKVLGREMSRDEAERLLKYKIESLDILIMRGAYDGSKVFKTDLEYRYDDLIAECNELEVALGL